MQEFEASIAEAGAPGAAAIGAPTAEDHEIDQMLERAARQNPVSDHGPDMSVVHEKKTRDVLRNYVENYKPASTPQELDDQVFQAGQHEIDSVEATEKLVTHFCRSSIADVKKAGYFIFKNVRVYIDGFFEQNKNADSLTMEQKLHSGGAKVDTVPIIRPQRI